MGGHRRWRSRRLLVAALLMTIAYVGLYYHLSRRGMREAPVYGLAGFLYVPFEQAQRTEDLSRHHGLALFFAPLNWADRWLTGAEGPTRCILWHLSG